MMSSMTGMKGPQQAGLAALGKPATEARGKSPESMAEIMLLAKRLSDRDLADVLNGKSLAVPQFAAMTEAMGRRSLRDAVKGQQAMAQAKQPSLKDKFMMEEAAGEMPAMPQMAQMQQVPQMQQMAEGGIAMLPADNMQSMDMASGGIIAFEEGGEVQRFNAQGLVQAQQQEDQKTLAETAKKLGLSIADVLTLVPRAGAGILNAGPIRAIRSTGANLPYIPDVAGGDFSSPTPFFDKYIRKPEQENDVAKSLEKPIGDQAGDYSQSANENKKVVTPAVPPGAVDPLKGDKASTGMPTFEELQGRKTTDFLSKFEGLGDKKRESQKAELDKERGIGALFRASSALLGSRNLSEAGGKFGKEQGAAMTAERAEGRAIEDVADQYNFNIAKAREAAEKGDMQLAMQFTQLANQNKYQMGMVDVYNKRNTIMGEAGNMGKVSTALLQADKQALAEAKQKYPLVTKTNQAAYDAFFKQRARALKMGNPLTKQYADLSGSDFGGGGGFNVVQSIPKGASSFDLDS